MAQFKDLAKVPNDQVRNFRNDMYLTSEALRIMQKSGKPQLVAADVAVLKNYKGHIDRATRFIPLWVKVAVALALGLGTMVGWKRIVVTVGEKIGKNHLTYAQAADAFGLPVSTTHVLSSGVAGTMAANRSGLQWATVRNLLMAWVLTLPIAMTLSGLLFWTFRKIF
jgi:inorganic phosphate transporter, PiT family